MAPIRNSADQQGVAMLVVLIFTLALTGIAIVSARLALMGESVARNQLDLQVARQAAEAALRDAEKDLMIANGAKVFPGALCLRNDVYVERPVMDKVDQFTPNCLRGQCAVRESDRPKVDFAKAASDPARGEAWWPEDRGGLWGVPGKNKPKAKSDPTCATFTGGVPLGVFTGANPIKGVAAQPEYLIELIRRNGVFFRITSRGFGYRMGTEVVLQSYFQVPQL